MAFFRRAGAPDGDALHDLLVAAYRAFDAQEWDAAAAGLVLVVETARSRDVPQRDLAGWVFDLALTHKFRRDWHATLTVGLEAAELAPAGEGEPAWWNLGIAATALHDWATARRAWTRYGVQLPTGDGPVDGNFGRAPVRIRTRAGAEVVWCERLDPARGKIENIPLPGSGRRWGEIVLHDGVPSGERQVDGRTYSVFDELALWAPSPVPVQAVELRVDGDHDVDALCELAHEAGFAAESWESVRMLCAGCSEGLVGDTHVHGPAQDEGAPGRCRVGVAAPLEEAHDLLRTWISAAPARRGAGTPETVA